MRMTVSRHINFRAYIIWCKIIKSLKNEKGHVLINYIVKILYYPLNLGITFAVEKILLRHGGSTFPDISSSQ